MFEVEYYDYDGSVKDGFERPPIVAKVVVKKAGCSKCLKFFCLVIRIIYNIIIIFYIYNIKAGANA